MNIHEQEMQHNFGRFTCSGDFVDLGTGDISFSVMFLNNSVNFFNQKCKRELPLHDMIKHEENVFKKSKKDRF
jgi:hypothetical protein